MLTGKIELSIDWEISTLIKIIKSEMDSVVDTLQLTVDVRNIRLIEYQPELFQMKPPYEIII